MERVNSEFRFSDIPYNKRRWRKTGVGRDKFNLTMIPYLIAVIFCSYMALVSFGNMFSQAFRPLPAIKERAPSLHPYTPTPDPLATATNAPTPTATVPAVSQPQPMTMTRGGSLADLVPWLAALAFGVGGSAMCVVLLARMGRKKRLREAVDYVVKDEARRARNGT